MRFLLVLVLILSSSVFAQTLQTNVPGFVTVYLGTNPPYDIGFVNPDEVVRISGDPGDIFLVANKYYTSGFTQTYRFPGTYDELGQAMALALEQKHGNSASSVKSVADGLVNAAQAFADSFIN